MINPWQLLTLVLAPATCAAALCFWRGKTPRHVRIEVEFRTAVLWGLLAWPLLISLRAFVPAGDFDVASDFASAIETRNRPESFIPRPAPPHEREPRSAPLASLASPGEPVAPPKDEGTSESSLRGPFRRFGFVLAGLWIVGIIGLACRRMAASRRLARVISGAAPCSRPMNHLVAKLAQKIGLRSTPQVVESMAVVSPASVGIFQPQILLPIGANFELNSKTLECVLLHELAHIRRGDLLTHGALRLLQILYWPLPWIQKLQQRHEHLLELSADAEVVRMNSSRLDYASALISVAHRASRPALATLSMLGANSREPSNMAERIDRILSDNCEPLFDPTSLRARLTLISVALLFVCGAWIFGVRHASAQTTIIPERRSNDKTAISDALVRSTEWIVKGQRKDGSWANENGQTDLGLTGLALLGLVGRGARPDAPGWEPIKAGVDFLLGIQAPDGLIGDRKNRQFMYQHAIATLVLGEVAAQKKTDADLKTALNKAVHFAIKAQNPYKGWRYGERPGDNDSAHTSWMLTALAAAKMAGVEVPGENVQWGLDLLRSLTESSTGRTGYVKRGEHVVRPEGVLEKFPAALSEAMTAQAMFSRIIWGESILESQELKAGLVLLQRTRPRWDSEAGSIDYYYWYFGTVVSWQAGDEVFRKWSNDLVNALLPAQEKAGAFAGSFPPVDPWAAEGGRVYSTVMAMLSLEVVHRDLKLLESPK